jgi:hypothetical protein
MTTSNKQIGTTVVSNDGFSTRIGQVADITTDRWGTWHVVSVDGDFVTVGHIGEVDMLGIGWKVASEGDVRRANRQREFDRSQS